MIFFVLTETWLTDSFTDCELGLSNYNIYRYDRCSITSNYLRGGGVLIGIRKYISSELVVVREINVEHLFVMLTVGSSKFIINAAYFPPLCPSHLFENFISVLETVYQHHPEHIFLLCGDYNLPEISWSNDSHGLTYTSSSALRVLCVPEVLAFNGFYQKNSIFNSKGSISCTVCTT
jgi:hypothetical protein